MSGSAPREANRRPQRTFEVSGGAALEWWRQRTAGGASLDASYGSRELSLVLQAGALIRAPSAQAFDAIELSASFAERGQPHWSYGVRVSAGIGAGWLDIHPREPYAPQGGTHVSAAYALLELSRPVWVGGWAVVPRASVRRSDARRTMDAEGQSR